MEGEFEFPPLLDALFRAGYSCLPMQLITEFAAVH